MAVAKPRKTYPARTNSLVVLFVAIAIILVIVVAGIVVSFLLTGDVKKIVLLCLIGAVLLVGVVSCACLNCWRRNAKQQRDHGAQAWVRDTYEEQRRSLNPSAPVDSETGAKPWRYSDRSTVPTQY